eukprot:252404_1
MSLHDISLNIYSITEWCILHQVPMTLLMMSVRAPWVSATAVIIARTKSIPSGLWMCVRAHRNLTMRHRSASHLGVFGEVFVDYIMIRGLVKVHHPAFEFLLRSLRSAVAVRLLANVSPIGQNVIFTDDSGQELGTNATDL